MHMRRVTLLAAAFACGPTERTASEATTTPPRHEPPAPPLMDWKDPPKEPGPPRPTQISLGRLHACARMSDDTLRCWGGNDWGQLGGGDIQVTTKQATPPIGDVVEVGAGGTYTCARKRDRTVWCWGYNYLGIIGTAPKEEFITTPTQIAGLTGAVALAAGVDHACVLRDDGTAWCWGYNQAGLLGDGSDQPRVGPVQVQGLTVAVAISSEYFTCARRTDATLACWGMNHGTRATPMPTLAGVLDLDIGTVGCARLADGSAHCWGANDSGQLGRPDAGPFAEPGPVAGLADVKAVAAATTSACAIVGAGDVVCWGDIRPYPWVPADCRVMTSHQGHGGSAAQWEYCPKPTRVPGLPPATALAMGWDRACILAQDAAIWCWGDGNPPAQVAL